jgi:hypothetical protein
MKSRSKKDKQRQAPSEEEVIQEGTAFTESCSQCGNSVYLLEAYKASYKVPNSTTSELLFFCQEGCLDTCMDTYPTVEWTAHAPSRPPLGNGGSASGPPAEVSPNTAILLPCAYTLSDTDVTQSYYLPDGTFVSSRQGTSAATTSYPISPLSPAESAANWVDGGSALSPAISTQPASTDRESKEPSAKATYSPRQGEQDWEHF